MGENRLKGSESQAKRLKIKTSTQQLKQLVIEGTGISQWESEILVKTINEVYFSDIELSGLRDQQLKYSCVSSSEGAGKPLSECAMTSVNLTLFSDEDEEGLPVVDKQASVYRRQRRIMRISFEAKDQGGLLSQEDLAKILMCDVRTIRRDIKELLEVGVFIPTRGRQKDIGPGVSHKEVAVRLWLEGVEPIEICTKIKHTISAVENYLEKFKRVAYLRTKNFDDFQTALTIGISVRAVKAFVELYDRYKNKPFAKERIAEVEIVGEMFYKSQGEKKELGSSKSTNSKGRMQ